MIYFYKKVTDDNAVEYLLTYDNLRPNITNSQFIEITKEEYILLKDEMNSKQPESMPETNLDDSISAEEFQAMIEEVL